MLVVLNGPPAVGKSTLARRYADDHALALVVDVDHLRSQLGQWQTVEASKMLARDLAVALVRMSNTQLLEDAEKRGALVVSVAGGAEAAYRSLRDALGTED